MKTLLTLAFALLLVGTGTGAALAQTPDQETVCDNEHGAAFGWCNSYCEAMDCDLANDSDPATTPHASDTACNKVHTKFQQATGHDMPCEAPVTCPCSDLFDFNDVLAFAASCVDLGNGGVAVSGVPEYDSRYSASSDGSANPSPVCGWSAKLPGQFDSSEYLPISPQQATACVQIIRDAIASRGLTCSSL